MLGNLTGKVEDPEDWSQDTITICMVQYTQTGEVIGDLNQARFFVEFYHVHKDKEWGITGCISFIVMKDHDLTGAFTSDEIFNK
ncbi:MAG: hypothetical protein QY310_14690 [Candidatus Jettenia sp. CY-1]|nr:MAG: hypothetical protein QY310_14690 [Candidatus Jettenia sp. CY-1]